MMNAKDPQSPAWRGCASIILFLLVVTMLSFGIQFVERLHFNEKISTGFDSVTMTECLYPFGSWFHMDDIGINASGFHVVNRGFFTTETVEIPYNSINRVTFKKGFYWKSIKLIPKGMFDHNETFYFRSDETYATLKFHLDNFKPNSIVVVEQSIR